MSNWKANRLRVLRAERRISQLALAQKLGVSQATFSMWETAYVEPDDQMKTRIARHLRVSVAALVPQAEGAVA